MSLSRAAHGIFVGYDEHRHAYRILLDGASQYVVAQVAVFNESSIIWCMLSSFTSSTCSESFGDLGEFEPFGGGAPLWYLPNRWERERGSKIPKH